MVKSISLKKVVILLLHAFLLWVICGATVVIGRNFTTIELTLIIHAIAVPFFSFIVSQLYYKKFNYTTPLQTALTFLIFIIVMDAGLVAPVFEKSYEMFKSVLGTWIPFMLIFISTYLTGLIIVKNPD